MKPFQLSIKKLDKYFLCSMLTTSAGKMDFCCFPHLLLGPEEEQRHGPDGAIIPFLVSL